MTGFNRWCAVALLVLLVVAVPVGVRALPAHDQQVSAADLLARIRASGDHGYSGYVESRGALELPVADRFTDVGALLGEQTRMRVWWAADHRWRVDKLLVSGETDLVQRDTLTTEWSYEQNEARRSADPAIRLPRTADLLPPALVERLLQDVDESELTRLDARRVAGRDALGLRLRPAAPQSSIDHVDLWADRESAIPLRVEVYGDAASGPALTSAFRDFSADVPDPALVAFSPPAGAEVSYDNVLDIADAANQYAPVVPPDTLAGLAKSPSADRAVGVYGSGVTRILALPLRGREAGPLREQLLTTLGVVTKPEGTLVSVGPLGLMLTGSGSGSGSGDDGGWLVVGTVTPDTLLAAARDLATGVRAAPDVPR
jgi:hypothetical protein